MALRWCFWTPVDHPSIKQHARLCHSLWMFCCYSVHLNRWYCFLHAQHTQFFYLLHKKNMQIFPHETWQQAWKEKNSSSRTGPRLKVNLEIKGNHKCTVCLTHLQEAGDSLAPSWFCRSCGRAQYQHCQDSKLESKTRVATLKDWCSRSAARWASTKWHMLLKKGDLNLVTVWKWLLN